MVLAVIVASLAAFVLAFFPLSIIVVCSLAFVFAYIELVYAHEIENSNDPVHMGMPKTTHLDTTIHHQHACLGTYLASTCHYRTEC